MLILRVEHNKGTLTARNQLWDLIADALEVNSGKLTHAEEMFKSKLIEMVCEWLMAAAEFREFTHRPPSFKELYSSASFKEFQAATAVHDRILGRGHAQVNKSDDVRQAFNTFGRKVCNQACAVNDNPRLALKYALSNHESFELSEKDTELQAVMASYRWTKSD